MATDGIVPHLYKAAHMAKSFAFQFFFIEKIAKKYFWITIIRQHHLKLALQQCLKNLFFDKLGSNGPSAAGPSVRIPNKYDFSHKVSTQLLSDHG